MKQTLPVVHCTYTEAEKSLAELLEESFRLYLIRILATPEKPVTMFAMSGRLFQGGTYVLRNKQPNGLPCRIVHPFIKGG